MQTRKKTEAVKVRKTQRNMYIFVPFVFWPFLLPPSKFGGSLPHVFREGPRYLGWQNESLRKMDWDAHVDCTCQLTLNKLIIVVLKRSSLLCHGC
jgi:hypothetical protein